VILEYTECPPLEAATKQRLVEIVTDWEHQSVCDSSEAQARGQFVNLEYTECPPLEAATKQRLVEL
jgi:hypothetical protein